MAASATDLFMEVGNPGTATTLSAPGYTAGATSITVGSTSNWPTATGVTFAIDEAEVVNGVEVQVAGTYNEYVGVVTGGTSVTNVDWARGVGDRSYSAGALTRVYVPVASERENRLAQGMVVSHDQDGTLKAGAVDNADVLASNVVTTPKILDSAVSTAKIADDAVTPSKISNPYQFRVYRTAAANTGNNVFALIAFDTETFDTSNNVASGVFTAPVDGYYQFNWAVQATVSAGADETLISALYINGAGYSYGNVITYRNLQGSAGSDVAYMTAGQTADIRVYAPINRPLNVTTPSVRNYFSGFLVAAT